MRSSLISMVAVCATFALPAAAATVTYSDSVALTATDWTGTAVVSQFNSALGTLNSVTLTLSSFVQGVANAESLDGSATTLSLMLDATVTADGAGALLTAVPTVSISQMVTAFDGTIDFGGTSGFSSGTVSGSDSDTQTAATAPFIGMGTISFSLAAAGDSSATGSGNLITQFSSSAGATLSVTYDYTEASAVPLPAGGLLLIGGLGALGAARRRKKAA